MSWYVDGWEWYRTNRAELTSIAVFLGGAVAAWAALRQAGIAARRHYAPTEADRQRRITESFSKAVEQLGSDRIEVRLGGIYTLERISHESVGEYWTVIETLTALVRERARWKVPYPLASETMARLYQDEEPAIPNEPKYRPATDIAAVLIVIIRRGDKNREREKNQDWFIDLRGSDLRGANLRLAHFERAILRRAHFEGADFGGAHLEGAILRGAHLEGATLRDTHLEGATLRDTYLENADLRGVQGLSETELALANANATTRLPDGVSRPAP